jgi:hypothetical protein
MIAYCGEVEVCIRYASLKTSRSSLRPLGILHQICEACDRPASSLCVDCVEKIIAVLAARPVSADGMVIAVEVMERRVRQPGFVEMQGIDHAVEHFLDFLDVVEDAVVGALGDGQYARFGGDRAAKGCAAIFFWMFSQRNSSFGIGPMIP